MLSTPPNYNPTDFNTYGTDKLSEEAIAQLGEVLKMDEPPRYVSFNQLFWMTRRSPKHAGRHAEELASWIRKNGIGSILHDVWDTI